MRRKDRKINNKKIITEILSKSIICRIGLYDEDYPYIVPLNYGYNDNTLYFHCAKSGKKLDLIRRNNKVCFEIEQPYEIISSDISCEWTSKYRSIIGFGTIYIITDNIEKRKGIDIIMFQHGERENQYTNNAIDNVSVLKLVIESLEGKQNGNW